MSGFVHLHLHTEYSLLDGACRIDRLFSRVKELGQTAVAVTDHGVMYGAVEFYKAAVRAGVKPIIGCEVYVAPRGLRDRDHRLDGSPYHLILLCENETGYRNLIKIVSEACVDGFYGKPRTDREALAAHHEGLFCLSGCLSGEVSRRLNEGNYEAAREAALFYRDIFGADHYYLEIQNHGLPEQLRILPGMARLSREIGVGLCATNDCHYLEKSDADTQKILMCIQTNHTLQDEDAMELPSTEFYLKSSEEMAELFAAYPEALANTVRIAERCNFNFVFHQLKLPLYTNPGGTDNESFFMQLCRDGLRKRYGENLPEGAEERLHHETDVIRRMGFVDYYLIVWDFIHYAKSKGIPVGPGRGSGAGSLCAYCMGITDIDPLRYNLLFERFLNPERVSMPDFDIDFCYVRRGEVIDYVTRRYGSDHVAQIVTFGTLAARAAVRDVGRVMGMPYADVDSVSRLIPRALGTTLDSALQDVPELKERYEAEPEVRRLIDISRRLEGFPRHTSTHAAGVVITRDPADCYVPLQKNDEQVVTQYTMKALEELGLLKMDFLGLRNLTIIADAEKAVRETVPGFSVSEIPLDDPAVFEMLSAGRAEGVFQFESQGIRNLLVQMAPKSLEDMIAAISLYRPGPMDSIPVYLENRRHPEKIRYCHPALKRILDVTYGCIVYQEQVMQIFRELAGYSLGRADKVRRAMAKKHKEEMEQEREIFLNGLQREDGSWECPGALRNGVSREDALKLLDDMADFASYAFNKSHAAAYALVSYRTAYLKAHYPVEYWSALLTSVQDVPYKITEYITVCRKQGIPALPPDVNHSYDSFRGEGKAIRFGLLGIRGVGITFVRRLIAERNAGGEFSSLYDFFYRAAGTDFNRRTAESLIRAGALDGFGYNRREMLLGFEGLLDKIEERRKFEGVGQLGFFGEAISSEETLPRRTDFEQSEKMRMEREATGLYISGHPLDGYAPLVEKFGLTPVRDILDEENPLLPEGAEVSMLGLVTEKKEKISRNGSRMAFVQMEDQTGTLEVLVFPQIFSRYGNLLKEEAPVLVSGKISWRENEERKLVADRILRPEESGSLAVKVPSGNRTTVDPCPEAQNPQQNSSSRPGLFLRLPSQNCPEFARVTNLLEIFDGREPVYFRFTDTGKGVAAPRSLWTAVCPVLISELKRVLGEENVVYREPAR